MKVWLVLALGFSSVAAAGPVQLAHQGRLLDAAGTPVNGDTQVALSLFDSARPDAPPIWTQTYEVHAENGYFAVILDQDAAGSALDSDWFSADMWVATSLQDSVAGPRQPMVSVPRAAHATRASDADRAVTAEHATTSDVAAEATRAELADRATVADQATAVVVMTGLTGSCSGAGTMAWDSAQSALRVCDGGTWRDPMPARPITLSDAGGTCDDTREGEMAYRTGHLWVCDGVDWRVVKQADGRPLIKATPETYTIAQIRAQAVDGTHLPRRYGAVTCGTNYHICNYAEAVTLKYILADHELTELRDVYLRTHGNYTAGEVAGTTHPHNSLSGYSTGAWNGPSLACPNNSGPMVYFYSTTNRSVGLEWDGGCYADDARHWACCLNRTY